GVNFQFAVLYFPIIPQFRGERQQEEKRKDCMKERPYSPSLIAKTLMYSEISSCFSASATSALGSCGIPL
ncbi:MAG: hypothetical protein OSJ60_23430, partial [Lachnospiraceae bacterium]|nr:hypothetical protein [Lachnospiraceae bacterium]